jgi:UDP-2,4-diacetamido-2,4,6-trideoxy-beta-L-altropyranose hydrolase
MSTNIMIRLDASCEIGFGHISRCMVLAESIRLRSNICFVSKFMPEEFIQKIIHGGFEFLKIEDDGNFDIFKASIVILDGYSFSSIYQQKVKLVAKKLVCIDELRDIYYHADVIINNQPCLKPKDFLCNEDTKIYSGLEFSMLRNEFISASKELIKTKKIQDKKTFFICFGGSDPSNFSKKIVKLLLSKNELFCINLVLGPGYKHDSKFSSNNVNVYKSLGAKNLINLIKKSDVAILPASTIILEAFCVGIPIISGWYSDKQKKTLECLHKSGYIFNCGDYRKNFENEMLRLISTISDENSNKFIEKQKKINFDTEFLNEIFF